MGDVGHFPRPGESIQELRCPPHVSRRVDAKVESRRLVACNPGTAYLCCPGLYHDANGQTGTTAGAQLLRRRDPSTCRKTDPSRSAVPITRTVVEDSPPSSVAWRTQF